MQWSKCSLKTVGKRFKTFISIFPRNTRLKPLLLYFLGLNPELGIFCNPPPFMAKLWEWLNSYFRETLGPPFFCLCSFIFTIKLLLSLNEIGWGGKNCSDCNTKKHIWNWTVLPWVRIVDVSLTSVEYIECLVGYLS